MYRKICHSTAATRLHVFCMPEKTKKQQQQLYGSTQNSGLSRSRSLFSSSFDKLNPKVSRMMSPAIWAKTVRCIGGDLGARAILLTRPVEEWQQAHVPGWAGTTTSTSAHCCWAVCKLKQTLLWREASPTSSRKIHRQSKQSD